MTHQPSTSQAADAAPVETALADRVAALELFMQQLVFLLDTNGALNADALNRWISTARARMLTTGSVPLPQVLALTRLQRQVQE